jgi:alkylation response protein AidB-like acyl-CoA dehydrogenase
MDLLPSAEQDEIVAVVGAFLAEHYPTSLLRQRRAEPSSFDAVTWSQCGELGWFALGLPESLGGVGYALAEEALLFRELGRHLATGPFAASALAARVAAEAGAGALAADIAAGTSPVALAMPRHGEPVVGNVVDGTFHVADGPGATHLLVVTPQAAAVVEAAGAGALEPVPSLDEGVRLARLTMERVPAVAALDGGAAAEIWLRGTVLISAMLTGVAEACRHLSTEHAKQRVQFGKPIGVHQAIKHACADMAMRAEAAGCQLVFAALSVDEQRVDRPFQVASARVVATDAAIRNASACVQVHGGMGFTFEHDSNLYVKRARLLDRMIGSRREHLAALLAAAPPP